jgi:hypothetical protein
MTPPCHRCLGLPTGLFPVGFQSNSFLVGLARSILCIYPSHLILSPLINLAISTPSDRLCGLVVRVSGYRYRGLGFDPRRYQIF